MNTSSQNIKIEVNKDSCSISYPAEFNLRLTQQEVFTLNNLTKESDELHSKYLSLCEKMYVSDTFDITEHHYQKYILKQLENLVQERYNLSCKIKKIQIESIKNSLMILEDMLQVKELAKKKSIINNPSKEVKQPSLRWKKLSKNDNRI